MVWVYFALCVVVILFAGKRLALYGDVISEKTGLGGAWIGAVLIAVSTSLPELFTGISSVTLVGAPDLTVGNLLGANSYNLLNLALIDIFSGGAVVRSRSPTHRLTTASSLVLVVLAGLAIVVSQWISVPGIGWIGWYTPLIFVLYLLFARRIFYAEQKESSLRRQESLMVERYAHVPVRTAYVNFAVSAALVIGAGLWLAVVGEEVSTLTGWGRSFVGGIFLSFATTLPEMSVSIAAMRIGAVDIAIANLAGSNLFNMVIIGIDDIFYTRGPLLDHVSASHLLTAAAVVLMLLPLIYTQRSKPRQYRRLSRWSVATILLFLARAYFSFTFPAP